MASQSPELQREGKGPNPPSLHQHSFATPNQLEANTPGSSPLLQQSSGSNWSRLEPGEKIFFTFVLLAVSVGFALIFAIEIRMIRASNTGDPDAV
ncbi:hypothetical protein AAF712_007299 [Marasmius tenuissimus]|uniref:Uncharacterized protein n=1 Tax=Marasmius tenuissimus TaxID=585030 RepID=A0ABR2ZXY3_9AGAR|nr:hypothetical protein PM082_013870 [Marasmius tenuissimus]